MKADSLQMGEVFSSGGRVHYVLPHFQREYAWEEQEWRTLLKDVFNVYELYDPKQPPEHFMGALVVINDGTQGGTVPVFRLVDGQQRLTSVSLLLAALYAILDETEENEELRHELCEMLTNRFKKEALAYKLLPTLKYGDQASYRAIIDGKPIPEVESQIPKAFAFFRKQLQTRLDAGDFEPATLFSVLMTCLQVVFINLDGRERPYEIFESLNYKGKSLTQADLVRNYIAMKLPPERQEAVFTELWSPIEEMLLEKRIVGKSRLGELTAFLRHYSAYRTGVLINQDHVYSRFRDRGESTIAEFEEDMARLKQFARYYDRLLRPQNETVAAVAAQLERLNTLESSTAYPLLLFLYHNWQTNVIDKATFLNALQLIETLLVRRFLARDSFKDLNRRFPTMIKEIELANFVPSLKEALWSKKEPSDTRLRQAAERISLYSNWYLVRQRLTLVLETINRHLSKGSDAITVLDGAATIEHLMPQTLSAEWKQHLGTTWEADHELLDTLGNLTLVTQGWNSALSNAVYHKKLAKLRQHGLKLNQAYFGDDPPPSAWDAEAIRKRGQWLMGMATEIWPQIGETAAGSDNVPKHVIVLGETRPVQSWRDVLRRTADAVCDLAGTAFEEKVVAAQPSYFSRETSSDRWYALPNGWSVYYNLNAETLRTVSEGMVESAEIPEDEYEIVLW